MLIGDFDSPADSLDVKVKRLIRGSTIGWFARIETSCYRRARKPGMSRVAKTKSVHPYVERKKRVCGGRPVIRGTRFPVSSIVWSHKLGFTIEEILREFPDLTPAQVYDALSYYHDHQRDVEAEIRQAHDLETWVKKYPSTLKVKHGRRAALP